MEGNLGRAQASQADVGTLIAARPRVDTDTALLPPPTLGPALLDQFAEPDRTGSVLGISRAGFHKIAYVEWGDPEADRVALCVHGLSRQGRDFDRLAAALAVAGWRVICPDLAGRGRSDWLRDPEDYNLPQYVTDMTVLLAHIGARQVDWIGTSLGGLIGMIAAGLPGSPVQRLVINDIGPFIPWQALHRLALSIRSAAREFSNLADAIAHYRAYLAPFGALGEREWEHLTRHNLEQLKDGTWTTRADPNITATFSSWFWNLTLWTYWDRIDCPTLVLRGAESDLLLARTAEEMSARGPMAKVIEIPRCGHAPALLSEDEIASVLGWLGAR